MVNKPLLSWNVAAIKYKHVSYVFKVALAMNQPDTLAASGYLDRYFDVDSELDLPFSGLTALVACETDPDAVLVQTEWIAYIEGRP